MNVKELIEQLQMAEPEQEVLININLKDGFDWLEIESTDINVENYGILLMAGQVVN